MEGANRAKRERYITIAIGLALVFLVAAFVVRDRFQQPPPPLTTDGVIVAQERTAEALEDFLRPTGGRGSGAAPEGSGTRPREADPADAARPAPEKIEPPSKRVEAEIDVSVGGEEAPPAAPPRRVPTPPAPAETRSTEKASHEVIEPVVPAERRHRTYVVKRGDSLSKIAERFYGRASDYVLIRRANNLPSANMLHVGQKLVIPEKNAEGRPARPVAPVREETRRTPEETYVVKRNDTLWKIATRLYADGGKWRTIFNANRDTLGTPNDLKVGQILKIPR